MHFLKVVEPKRHLILLESGSDPILGTSGVFDLDLLSRSAMPGVPVVQELGHLLLGERVPFEGGRPADRTYAIQTVELLAPVWGKYEVERRAPVGFDGDQQPEEVIGLDAVCELESLPIHIYETRISTEFLTT
jgi:hypothetical protein